MFFLRTRAPSAHDMTKVLFSNPPWWSTDEKTGGLRRGIRAGSRWPFTMLTNIPPDEYQFGQYTPAPFFLQYAATYAQKHTQAEVLFRDSIALNESYRSFYGYLRGQRPDLLVVESASPSWDHDSEILGVIRQVMPEIKVIVTGPITSTQSISILAKHTNVIACIKGECEKGVVRVINGERGVIEHDLLTTEEMNAAPFPWYDETIAHKYWDACPKGQLAPHAQIFASRGCPYRCVFCVWPGVQTGNDPDGTGKRSVRFYSADYMERFIRHLVSTYGYRSIYFDDDTFNLGNKHTQEMCAVMKKIGLPWFAMCRADTSTEETWRMMKDSGCQGVKLGFESGSQYVVDEIVNKGLDLEKALETVKFLVSIGIDVHGTFTSGLPGETPEQVQQTFAYIERLKAAGMSTHQHSGTAVIEGTPLFALEAAGHLDKYPGAKIDENYKPSSDGQKKFEAIRAELSAL